MHFILIAVWLSVQTGSPTGYERVGQPFEIPEDCLKAQADQSIQKAVDGRVRAFICVREDQLHEAST